MNAFLPAIQVVVGLALLWQSLAAAGWPRRLGHNWAGPPVRRVPRIGFSIVAALAGAAVLLAIANPFLNFFACCLAAVTAVWLLWMQRAGPATGRRIAAVGLLAASIVVAIAQPLGLKVLLLPKAAEMPYEPVVARVLKTYDEGVWFESVRAATDGTLFLSANRGIDFARGDYYRGARGEIIARSPDGAERVLFRTPTGTTAGVIAIAADGTLFMSSHGVSSGIWRITTDGRGELLSRLPAEAWPNGLDFGPDGALYSPDSALGLVWRIDPATGRAKRALVDKRLAARRFVALAPGANGLHFRGRDMIVTVSDATTVLKYTLESDGRFDAAVELASGIPGDDFAVGPDGSLFISTHPYNTVVRVAADGRRSVIADARQQIVGATDAAFGRTDADRGILYVATDGGAFTGGPQSRGRLIALSPYAAQ